MDSKANAPHIGHAAGQVLNHLARFMAAEVALTQMEVKSAITAAVRAAVIGCIGVVIALATCILLGISLSVIFITLGMIPWVAYLLTSFIFLGLVVLAFLISLRLFRYAVETPSRIYTRVKSDIDTLIVATKTEMKNEKQSST